MTAHSGPRRGGARLRRLGTAVALACAATTSAAAQSASADSAWWAAVRIVDSTSQVTSRYLAGPTHDSAARRMRAATDTALAAARRRDEPLAVARALNLAACVDGYLGHVARADTLYAQGLALALRLPHRDAGLALELADNRAALAAGELGRLRMRPSPDGSAATPPPDTVDAARHALRTARRRDDLQRRLGLAGNDRHPVGRTTACGVARPTINALLWAFVVVEQPFTADRARFRAAFDAVRDARRLNAFFLPRAVSGLQAIGADAEADSLLRFVDDSVIRRNLRVEHAVTRRDIATLAREFPGYFEDAILDLPREQAFFERTRADIIAVAEGPAAALRAVPEGDAARLRDETRPAALRRVQRLRFGRLAGDTVLTREVRDWLTARGSSAPSVAFGRPAHPDLAVDGLLEAARGVLPMSAPWAAAHVRAAVEGANLQVEQALDVVGAQATLGESATQEERLVRIAALDTALAAWSSSAIDLALRPGADTALQRAAADLALPNRGRVLDLATRAARLRHLLPPARAPLLAALRTARVTEAAAIRRGDLDTADDAAERADSIARVVDREAELLAPVAVPVTSTAVAAALPARSAYVEYVRFARDTGRSLALWDRWGPRRLAAVVVPAEGPVRIVDLGPADAVDSLAVAWGRRLREGGDDRATGAALAARLVAPLRGALDGRSHWIIAADGALATLPLAALPLDASRRLLDTVLVSHVTGAREILAPPPPSRVASAPVIVAAPAYGDVATAAPDGLRRAPWAALPGTRAEADRIRAVLPDAALLTDTLATKAAMFALDAPRILHVATHGYFAGSDGSARVAATRGAAVEEAPPPRGDARSAVRGLVESGLVFAGVNADLDPSSALLTALEAQELALDATELVVLSACESGLGSVEAAEGVFGMRRALAVAGAQTLLVSLWEVPDAETAELMAGYYAALARGAGRAEALRAAQQDFRRARPRAPAFAWGAFIVSGRWEPLGATPYASVDAGAAYLSAADERRLLEEAEAGPFAQVRWRVPWDSLGVSPRSGLRLQASRDGVFVLGPRDTTTGTRAVVAVDGRTGRTRWRQSIGNSLSAIYALDGALVLFGRADQRGTTTDVLVGADPSTGVALWTRDFPGSDAGGSAPSVLATDSLVLVARPVGFDATEVFALDARTGARRWTRRIGWLRMPRRLVLAQASDGIVLFAQADTERQAVLQVDPRTGTLDARADEVKRRAPVAVARATGAFAASDATLGYAFADAGILRAVQGDGMDAWRRRVAASRPSCSRPAGEWLFAMVLPLRTDDAADDDAPRGPLVPIALRVRDGTLATARASAARVGDALPGACAAVGPDLVVLPGVDGLVAVSVP